MPTLIEQLLLDDPSQIIERGNFFEISSEGIIKPVTDLSDGYINNRISNNVLNKLAESSEHLQEILNTSLREVKKMDIESEFGSEVFKMFKDRKEELVIDSFYYQINFNVDFVLNYFENISKIYLTICPSFKSGLYGEIDPRFVPKILDIGVTGYLCSESNKRAFHQEKLSFKPRATVVIQDLFWATVNNLQILINNVFKHDDKYNGMISLFKGEIAEKLALLMYNVD